MSKQCLVCYDPLQATESGYHRACAQALFGTTQIPKPDFTLADVEHIASQEINARLSITGVQRKLSLGIIKHKGGPRLTFVNLWGQFVFKPPSADFGQLPENEALTMQLARICGIETAEHGLIAFEGGTKAYISRRFDRVNQGQQLIKLHQEDLCQLTGKLTDGKYFSSTEKVARTVYTHVDNKANDVLRLFELILFCFITGNSDMHLKNFSLYTTMEGVLTLTPAYDLVSVPLALPADLEELALTVDGKKSKLSWKNFLAFGRGAKLNEKAIQNARDRLASKHSEMNKKIAQSFLTPDLQKKYRDLIQSRLKRLVG